MRLKFFAAVTILVTASVAAFAQNDEPGNQAPKPTVADLQRLVQTISSDKAKLKVYCEISKLQEEMEKAEEKNDTKTLEALGTKVDSLEQQIGPDYIRVIDGLGEVDPNSMEGQKCTAILDPLHKQCK
jgi:Skp family chaperone for outer membrane proteins